MRAFYRGCLLSIVVTLTGCATCVETETDPTKVSTCQLLVSKNSLDKHLEQRKLYLNEMSSRVLVLDDELLGTQATLFKLKGELDKAEIPEKELQKLLQDIEVMEAEQDQLSKQILLSLEEIEQLEADVAVSKEQQPELDAAMTAAQKRLANMEIKYEVLKVGVDRVAAINRDSE